VSSATRRDWLKWCNQLRNVKVPRCILYWICNPGKDWKVFISNRVSNTHEITQDTGIVWRHCPTDKNLADLGSHCASIDKMQKGKWFEGQEWLVNKEEWPCNQNWRECKVYTKSTNGAVFRTTTAWIKKIRKSEELQDNLARQ